MITVQVTAFDANGRNVAFSLGMATRREAAKAAAFTGIHARIAADKALAAKVRTFSVEAI